MNLMDVMEKIKGFEIASSGEGSGAPWLNKCIQNVHRWYGVPYPNPHVIWALQRFCEASDKIDWPSLCKVPSDRYIKRVVASDWEISETRIVSEVSAKIFDEASSADLFVWLVTDPIALRYVEAVKDRNEDVERKIRLGIAKSVSYICVLFLTQVKRYLSQESRKARKENRDESQRASGQDHSA